MSRPELRSFASDPTEIAGNQASRQRTGNTKPDAMSRRVVVYVLPGQTQSRLVVSESPRAGVGVSLTRQSHKMAFRRNGKLCLGGNPCGFASALIDVSASGGSKW